MGIELSWCSKGKAIFSGFHHDLMNAVEKSGALQFVNKVMYENGCYMADVIIDGMRFLKKTFFPAEWPREKVISKIYEAYENFLTKNISPVVGRNGKYTIAGFTSEGIEIEMRMTVG